jgi:hypothetical protein
VGAAVDIYKVGVWKVEETNKVEKQGEMENLAKQTSESSRAKLQGKPGPNIAVDQMIAIALTTLQNNRQNEAGYC